MPIPNSTTTSSTGRVKSASKPNSLATSAIRPSAIFETSPTVTIGSSAATGLRKITPVSTMISSTVAIETTVSASVMPSWKSCCTAAPPVCPAVRPLPSSAFCVSARSSTAASWASCSTSGASNLTAASCVSPFGEMSCLPVSTPTTCSTRAAFSRLTASAISPRSAARSFPPSARLKTMIDDPSSLSAKALASAAAALLDS